MCQIKTVVTINFGIHRSAFDEDIRPKKSQASPANWKIMNDRWIHLGAGPCASRPPTNHQRRLSRMIVERMIRKK